MRKIKQIRIKIAVPIALVMVFMGFSVVYAMLILSKRQIILEARDVVQDKYQTFKNDNELLINKGLIAAGDMALSAEVIEAYQNSDEEQARKDLSEYFNKKLQYFVKIGAQKKMKMYFHKSPAVGFLKTWLPIDSKNYGEDLSYRKTILKVLKSGKPFSSFEDGKNGLQLSIIVPVIEGNKYLGSAEAIVDMSEITENTKMEDDEGVVVYKLQKNDDNTEQFIPVNRLKTDSLIKVPRNILSAGTDTINYQIIDNKLYNVFPIKDLDNKTIAVICYINDFSDIISASRTEIRKLSVFMFILFIVLMIILTGALLLLVSSPLKNLITELEPFKKGDFTNSINLERNDEIGQLASALNDTSMKMKELIGSVQGTVDNLNQAGEHINSSAQDVSQGASEQAASVEEVSASMEQMTANVEQNMHNAQITEKNVLMAAAAIFEGNKSVKRTADLMRNIMEKVTVINDIAKQTNILALNASVEAAAAGEFGKGFSVIAREIRELAEYSRRAAVEIVENVKQGAAISDKASKQLGDIVKQMETTSELIKQISIASQEQNNGIEQITNGIQQLNKVTQQNAAVSEEMATNSEELAGQAEMLKNVVQYFKLGNFQIAEKEITPVSNDSNNDFNFVADAQVGDLSQFVKTHPTPKEKGIHLDLGDISDNDFERF